MINYYFNNEFDEENKYRPYTHELEANDDTLPPDNALRIAPPEKDGFIACEQNGKWVLVEDHRDSTVYDINTQESSVVDYLGKIKDGFTLLEPFEFCKWNGKKWVKDEEAERAFKIKQNETIRDSLLNEANEKIAIVQDIIDLDMQEADEEAQLKQWKRYRILLTRCDTSQLDIEWPQKPIITY